jgi:hypothetical protein
MEQRVNQAVILAAPAQPFADAIRHDARRQNMGNRRLRLVQPAGHDVAIPGHHGIEALLSMSARSMKSVSVAPGIRQAR